MITESNQQQLSSLVVNIAYPALILSSALSAGERIEGTALPVAVGVTIVLIALTTVVPLVTMPPLLHDSGAIVALGGGCVSG